MTPTSADLRTALATALTEAREKCRALEYVDLTHLREGGRLPTHGANPFVVELLSLVAAVVEEHPDWCSCCAHAGASCGGVGGVDCPSFWATDWAAVRAAAFDVEAKALGLATRDFGWVVVPSVEFFSHPRTPREVLDVLREYIDWSYQDYAQGRDPDGDGYEAASKKASAFEAEYAKRI